MCKSTLQRIHWLSSAHCCIGLAAFGSPLPHAPGPSVLSVGRDRRITLPHDAHQNYRNLGVKDEGGGQGLGSRVRNPTACMPRDRGKTFEEYPAAAES